MRMRGSVAEEERLRTLDLWWREEVRQNELDEKKEEEEAMKTEEAKTEKEAIKKRMWEAALDFVKDERRKRMRRALRVEASAGQ